MEEAMEGMVGAEGIKITERLEVLEEEYLEEKMPLILLLLLRHSNPVLEEREEDNKKHTHKKNLFFYTFFRGSIISDISYSSSSESVASSHMSVCNKGTAHSVYGVCW